METPPLVTRAVALAGLLGSEEWCRPEDGALLHVLAARRGISRAAEIGTGCGVGAAWIVSALPPEAPFDLLFVDADDAKDDVGVTVGLLAPGGTAVLDDFRLDPALPDPRRDAWLHHPLLTTIELWVTRERRALVSVRR